MSDLVLQNATVVQGWGAGLPPDPMSEAAWRALRPAGKDVADYKAALDRLEVAMAEADARLERLAGERRTALLHGTADSVAQVGAKIAVASVWAERVRAVALALPDEIAEAERREAAREHCAASFEQQAGEAIKAFEAWMTKHYAPAAQTIAAGIELERVALKAVAQLRTLKPDTAAALPMLRAHTSFGHPSSPPSTFGDTVRLPRAEPGGPIHWSGGPAYTPFSIPHG